MATTDTPFSGALMRHAFAILLSLGVLVCFSGCDKGGTTAPATTGTSSTGSAGDHGHDHSHGEGEGHDHAEDEHAAHSAVHGGHMIDFGDAPFKAEWNHSNDNDIIEVFILNQEGTADMPIKAESITIRTTTGSEKESFTLPAEKPAADGTSAHFRLDEQKLRLAMTLGVEVEVAHDGTTYKATIPPHAAHDH
jgi:hypothetical protein